MGNASTRILIADDHTLIAEAYKKILEPVYDVVGIVGDGRALLKASASLHPQLIILDIAMPLLNGLDAAVQLKHKMPDVKIVFLTMNDDPELAAEAFRRGASAYLPKTCGTDELLSAVHEVSAGRLFVSPSMAKIPVDLFSLHDAAPPGSKRQLTERQCEVLQLLVEGKRVKEIAGLLNVTARTVAFHRDRIKVALDLNNRSDLIRYAVRHRIIEL